MNRRDFIGKVAATGAVVLSQTAIKANETNETTENNFEEKFETPKTVLEGEMIYRTLGATGEKVSAIGMGGFHIGKPETQAESTKLIRTGVDRGITFMDNCWDYHNGESEIRMGKALKDGYR
ncbi:MAG: aldo/keto reductase, partial [Acidobacteriota bacterium]